MEPNNIKLVPFPTLGLNWPLMCYWVINLPSSRHWIQHLTWDRIVKLLRRNDLMGPPPPAKVIPTPHLSPFSHKTFFLDPQTHHTNSLFSEPLLWHFPWCQAQTSSFESPASFGPQTHPCSIKAGWLERSRNCHCPLKRKNTRNLQGKGCRVAFLRASE